MKNVFNFLTLLSFNSVFSQVEINTTFPKATLDIVSQQRIKSLIKERNTSKYNTRDLSTTIFTSLANMNNFLQQKNTIAGLINKLVTFQIKVGV